MAEFFSRFPLNKLIIDTRIKFNLSVVALERQFYEETM